MPAPAGAPDLSRPGRDGPFPTGSECRSRGRCRAEARRYIDRRKDGRDFGRSRKTIGDARSASHWARRGIRRARNARSGWRPRFIPTGSGRVCPAPQKSAQAGVPVLPGLRDATLSDRVGI